MLNIFKYLIDLFKPKQKSIKQEIWKTEIYDTLKIQMPKTTFFQDTHEEKYKKVTSFTESEILEFLITKKGVNLIIKELHLNLNSVEILKEQKYPFIKDPNTKPGDIDLIIFDSNKKNEAIAIEVKCIKAETFFNKETKYNKEKNLTKGITQVNEYLKFGFHKTFLIIIILDNGENNTQNNQFFRDADLKTSKRLFNDRIIANLNKDIGLIYFKVNQITGKSINKCGKISILVKKQATPFVQNVEITNNLKVIN